MSQHETLQQHLRTNQYTWLITGVAGFIGSNLLETLLTLNQKVIGLDNFSTGFQHNLDEALKSANCQLPTSLSSKATYEPSRHARKPVTKLILYCTRQHLDLPPDPLKIRSRPTKTTSAAS